MTARPAVLLVLLAVSLASAPAASAQPAWGLSVATAPLASLPEVGGSPVVLSVMSLLGLTSGIGDLQDEVDNRLNAPDSYGESIIEKFQIWGSWLYVLLFALQFLLIGAIMVVKGPFAIASYRPIHALNPFANFFFFLLAGALGFLFVSNSFYIDALGNQRGWVLWLYDFFSSIGQKSGCGGGNNVWYIINNCDPDGLAAIGMRMSGALMVLSQDAGNTPSNPVNWLVNSAGASSGVFGAFSVLAIQLAITQIAFKLAIVTAPLFLATLVFRPFAGMSTGYLNFVLYLGIKLLVLYLVASLASFIANEWLQAMIAQVLLSMLTNGAQTGADAGGLFSFHLSVLTMSMLFLALTLYLPTKIASTVSQSFQLDLNAILFRGELPIAID